MGRGGGRDAALHNKCGNDSAEQAVRNPALAIGVKGVGGGELVFRQEGGTQRNVLAGHVRKTWGTMLAQGMRHPQFHPWVLTASPLAPHKERQQLLRGHFALPLAAHSRPCSLSPIASTQDFCPF